MNEPDDLTKIFLASIFDIPSDILYNDGLVNIRASSLEQTPYRMRLRFRANCTAATSLLSHPLCVNKIAFDGNIVDIWFEKH
jgi:hypothetical protein